ncbi:leucine zipper domain-containing protein (plasmid) [Xanthomonas sontii]|uniref:leucine zipper domain-containing protein n=1 Tax=Xanthomonas sontii TaxID=2650745 RepID=UPI003F845872
MQLLPGQAASLAPSRRRIELHGATRPSDRTLRLTATCDLSGCCSFGASVEVSAHAIGVRGRTAYKWLSRLKEEGTAGLKDCSSRPRHGPHAILPRDCGAASSGISNIARVLRRAGLHRLDELEPALPHNRYRYEYAQPGQLLHLGTKRLARSRQTGHRVTR